jgi:hypothetical protein
MAVGQKEWGQHGLVARTIRLRILGLPRVAILPRDAHVAYA